MLDRRVPSVSPRLAFGALRVLGVLMLATACDAPQGPLQARDRAFVWTGTAAPGDTVTIRDFAGNVTVEPSADDSVRAVARLEWRSGSPDRSVRFSGTDLGGQVLLCALWQGGTCDAEDFKAEFKGRTDARVHFTVQVPAGVKVVAITLLGDLAVQASAPVRAFTLSGDIRVATAVGPVNGETLNGDVDLRMASLAGTDSVVGKTLNGDVFLYLPAIEDATVDLATATGKVTSAFTTGAEATSGKQFRTTFGAGTRAVVGKVLNGDVTLARLDSAGRSP